MCVRKGVCLSLGVDRGEGRKMELPPRLGLETILGLLGHSLTYIGVDTRFCTHNLILEDD